MKKLNERIVGFNHFIFKCSWASPYQENNLLEKDYIWSFLHGFRFFLHQLGAADFKLGGLGLSLGEDNGIAIMWINIRDEI